MPRSPNSKQVNFVVDEDILTSLDKSDNKSRDINEALRRFYSLPGRAVTVEDIRKVVREELGKHVCDGDCYVCTCPQCEELILNSELDQRVCSSCFFVFDGRSLERALDERQAHIAEVDRQANTAPGTNSQT